MTQFHTSLLAARGRSPVGRATRSYGAYARREEEAMPGHRRRRATPQTRRNPWSPFGLGRLPTRPAGLLPRAASDCFRVNCRGILSTGVLRLPTQQPTTRDSFPRQLRGPMASAQTAPWIKPLGSNVWRRGRDSNPRTACTVNGFRDRPVRPLRHLSFSKTGGEGGIRTLGTGLPHTRFPVVHHRPLGHLSLVLQRTSGGEGPRRTRSAASHIPPPESPPEPRAYD